MGGFSSWIDCNWFNLIQTFGIVGGLCLTASAATREAKAREVENLLTLADQHRQLWEGVAQRKELARLFQTDINVLTTPPTVAETEFLNSVIVHFQTGWWIAISGGITGLHEMRMDARGFFSLPLPRAVWESTKKFRNKRFICFIERALKLPM